MLMSMTPVEAGLEVEVDGNEVAAPNVGVVGDVGDTDGVIRLNKEGTLDDVPIPILLSSTPGESRGIKSA